ncbi:hypothetical protein ACJ41O_009459 [Fusarium nematophilum]
MDTNHSSIRFQHLPFDIHFEVAKQLDYLGILRLASTSRLFHQILNPNKILPKPEINDFFTERDQYHRTTGRDIFACYKCHRFLPKSKFQRKKGMYRTHDAERCCFDCAAKLRLHDHLRPISNGKLRYYFCHNCGRYETKSARCHGKRLDEESGEDEVATALSLCTTPHHPQHGLEALPTHLLIRICSSLEFPDLLHLKQASRALKDAVEPNRWVPLHTRFRFIRDKWTLDTLDVERDDIASYPCYMCFRIRPKESFTQKQLELFDTRPETAWKLRCRGCLSKMDRGKKSFVRVEHKRRRMCEICKCIWLARRTCGGCLELYRQGGIDYRTMYPEEEEVVDYQENLNRLDGVFDVEDWAEMAVICN